MCPNGSVSYERNCPGWEAWHSGPSLGDKQGRTRWGHHMSHEAMGIHGWRVLEGEFRQVSFKAPRLLCWKLGDPSLLWGGRQDCRGWKWAAVLESFTLLSPSGSIRHLDSNLNIKNNTAHLKKKLNSKLRTALSRTTLCACLSQWGIWGRLTLGLLGPPPVGHLPLQEPAFTRGPLSW